MNYINYFSIMNCEYEIIFSYVNEIKMKYDIEIFRLFSQENVDDRNIGNIYWNPCREYDSKIMNRYNI